MGVGLQWHYKEGHEEKALLKAIKRYQERFQGIKSEVCYVHPDAIKSLEGIEIDGLEIRPGAHITRGHFWMGVENEEKKI